MRDRDDDAPVEHDPTGMRDLLSRLPEPGPMPEDLVARITASLATESRDGGSSAAASSATTAGARVLEMPRRRRSMWPLLGVAAAVVGVLGLGGIVASTTPGGLTAALDLGGGEDSAISKDSAGSAAESAPEAGAGSAARGAAIVTWTGTAYEGANLGEQAAALASSSGPSDDSTGSGAALVATPQGARSCAEGLGIAPEAGLVVDVATFEGRPAAVLLVTDDGGHSAYAVERSCSAQAPDIIAGPVPVTP